MAWTPGKGGASRYNTPESNGGGETFVRIKDEGDSERMALLMPPFETYFGVSSYKDKDGNDKPSTVVNYPCTLDGSTLAFWGSGRAGFSMEPKRFDRVPDDVRKRITGE